ncbi:MAG: glycosyltransferase family 4 protein [Chloroflexi bacterium]|nr:glycosyltransferase family 4 protein [Chloroflexota bacterium]
MSSIDEGLPSVLIEALALGYPVVCTNFSSGLEEILEDGKYGDIVPIGDSEQLAASIENILDGNFKTIDQAWRDRFSMQGIMRKYIRAIRG